MKYLLTMTMMMFLTLCALNELQWRLIDMPSLKNLFFMHMQIYFFFYLNFSRFLLLLLLLAHFLIPILLVFESSTASICEFMYNNIEKHICCCCFHYFKYLTDGMTDWLTEYILWLSKYSTNESSTAVFCLSFFAYKKKEWNVCGSRYKEKKWKEWYAESVCYT